MNWHCRTKTWLNLTLLNNVGKLSTRFFSILQTPGPHPGAQLDFFETIDRFLDEISNESGTFEPATVKLKLAADGAKVSRISSFLVLSQAVLNDGYAVMSSTRQHTLAIDSL